MVGDTYTIEEMKTLPKKLIESSSAMTRQMRGLLDDNSFDQNAELFFVGGLDAVNKILSAVDLSLPIAIGFYQVNENVQGDEAKDEEGRLPGLPDFELQMAANYYLFSDGEYREVDKNQFNLSAQIVK